ncbi:MAG: ribbon-helix-helix protein, CopG family [Acidiferrobacteraceae bacterium]
MTTLSIRVPDDLLKEVDKHAHEMHIARTEYIRRAIEFLNAKTVASHRHQRMLEVSRRVREESLRINAEFDAVEDAPDA